MKKDLYLLAVFLPRLYPPLSPADESNTKSEITETLAHILTLFIHVHETHSGVHFESPSRVL